MLKYWRGPNGKRLRGPSGKWLKCEECPCGGSAEPCSVCEEGTTPANVGVVFTGFTDDAIQNCTGCDSLNGGFVVPQYEIDSCIYTLDIESVFCDIFACTSPDIQLWRVNVFFYANSIRVDLVTCPLDGAVVFILDDLDDGYDCSIERDIPLWGSGDSGFRCGPEPFTPTGPVTCHIIPM